MNWTGGRLRRQSHNRPDSLLRIQKQHFAKAHLKKRESNNKKAAISHFRSTPNGRDNASAEPRYYSIRHDDAIRTTRQPEQAIPGSFDITHGGQSHQKSLDSSSTSIFKLRSNAEDETGPSYIDNIKQHLLHKNDWVGLSPTRPVHVNFVPIEEKEIIGKRRKLASVDETRTAAITRNYSLHSKPSFAFDGQWHPTIHAESESNINIQIHTAEPALETPRNSRSPIRTNSSDSLLLDDAVCDELEEEHVSVSKGLSIEPEKQQGFSQLQQWQKGNAARDSSEPLTDGSSTMPVLHRFTLDDQILAEKERSSELNHSTSKDQQLSSHKSLGDHFAGNAFDGLDGEQASFSIAAKVDDRFSENTCSCGSNSDLLPQTQKISRQLPPQPISTKRPAFYTPFRTTRNTQVSDFTRLNAKSVPQFPQETVSFFGQSIAIQGMPDEANKGRSNCSSPTQTFMAAPNQDEYFSGSPPYIAVTGIGKPDDRQKESGRSPEKPPRFRFPSHWTPHRNEKQIIFADEGEPTDIPTSPFVVAAARASSPFERPRKPLYAFDNGFTSASHQENEHEDCGVVPYFDKPFHR